MKGLIEILNKFDAERDKRVVNGKWVNDADRKDEAVAECFYPCAKEILCNGYFLVNNKYIIDLGAIELYYHEEEGSIKDHIMYHTNEHQSKSKVFEKNGNKYPYFKFGSFNLHQSGVDVTFENEEQHYRASFLIRSYRVFNKDEQDKVYGTQVPFDKCSTHIFDDMFYDGITFYGKNKTVIEWVEFKKCDGEPKIEQRVRVNVPKYKKVGEKYEKDDLIEPNGRKICKSDYDIELEKEKNDHSYVPKYFKYNKKFYKQDMRFWHFRREDIKEQ